MTEWKGYVTPDGRVIGRDRDLRHDEDHIGMLQYKETHYNLRRHIVSRAWIATYGLTLANNHDNSHFLTRREAIQWLLDRHTKDNPDG